MIVLDTNVISEMMRERGDAAVIAWLDSAERGEVWTTTTTLAELIAGIMRLPEGRRRSDLAAALERMVKRVFEGRILPFGTRAAVEYGRVTAACRRAGKTISLADAQIAAMVAVSGATLATRNVRDFAATGIAVVDPWTAVSSPD